MDVAYAKLNASSPKDPMSTDLAHIGNGGWPKNAIHALTGRSDTRGVMASDPRDASKSYELLYSSIKEGRPILLATNPMKDMPHDGLVKGSYQGPNNPNNSGHAYTVEGVGRDKDGNVSLTLRNPWGTNAFAAQGVNSTDPIVHVDLKTILENGHLQSVTIGPAMVQKQDASAARHQQDAAKQNTAPGTPPASVGPRSADIPTAPGDPARALWSDLAARGREIGKNPPGMTPVDGAGPAHAAANVPARACWSELAAKAAEIRTSAQGTAPTGGPALDQGRGRSL